MVNTTLDIPKILMTLWWSNSFMQAASRRKSSISVRVQIATEEREDRENRKKAKKEGTRP